VHNRAREREQLCDVPTPSDSVTNPPADSPSSASTFGVTMTTQIAIRTLRAAGFTITNSRGQTGTVREIECERPDIFGIPLLYAVVLCDAETPTPAVEYSRRAAERAGRTVVVVARSGGAGWIGWRDFVDALGGAVPTWRALDAGYAEVLADLAEMRLPTGIVGEPWRLFEEAVADGLEFLLGRRVQRLGGLQRGQRVADLLAQRPDDRLLVVDAKATAGKFNADWPALRALVEYVKLQRERQRGQSDVGAALIVAPGFRQNAAALSEVAGEFLTEAEVTLVFVPVNALQVLVRRLTERPTLRAALQWAKIFGRPGLLTARAIEREIAAAERTRVEREPVGVDRPSGPA